MKEKKKWHINHRERARALWKVLSTHQREASQNPSKNQIKITTYIRPIRDRGDRFPSFIDSFCSVRDCFRFGFERFFDRFCFLQHLLKRFLLRVCSSLLIESEALLHSNSQRAMIFERLKPFTPFHNLRGKPKRLSISLSLSYSLRVLSVSFSLVLSEKTFMNRRGRVFYEKKALI